MKPLSHFLIEQRPKVDATPHKPFLDVDKQRITLLHGTTDVFAKSIRANGFLPGQPANVARWIEDEYDLPRGSVYKNVAFEFARTRHDLDRVHMTADPAIAKQYTIPEVLQDALHAVWLIKINKSDRLNAPAQSAWMKEEGRRLVKPEILAVNMPFDVVGDHCWGKKLTLEDFLRIGLTIDKMHSVSMPMSALYDYVVSPFSG
jgi:hypothetical protein